jgi:hypothetical protein
VTSSPKPGGGSLPRCVVARVLDHDHGVSGIDELFERVEQSLDIGQMQSCRRLVEDVDGVFRTLQLASSVAIFTATCPQLLMELPAPQEPLGVM